MKSKTSLPLFLALCPDQGAPIGAQFSGNGPTLGAPNVSS